MLVPEIDTISGDWLHWSRVIQLYTVSRLAAFKSHETAQLSAVAKQEEDNIIALYADQGRSCTLARQY